MKQTIDDQIMTVELLLLSQRGHVDNLKRLASKKERQAIHVEDAEAKLPKIRAVLETLKWLKLNEEQIKAALKAKK
jgi:hypothetical protein